MVEPLPESELRDSAVLFILSARAAVKDLWRANPGRDDVFANTVAALDVAAETLCGEEY